MELIRNRYDPPTSPSQEEGQLGGPQLGTEVFDSALPSELQFDELITEDLTEEEANFNGKVATAQFAKPDFPSLTAAYESAKSTEENTNSLYHLLTKSVISFTLKKTEQTPTNRQPTHATGSFIPFQLEPTIFPARFYDERSELASGWGRKLWSGIMGYVSTELYINGGYIYLLERQKLGFKVQTSWDIVQLFKVFSDREEGTLRLIFRKDGELLTRELRVEQGQVLAQLFQSAGQLWINCE